MYALRLRADFANIYIYIYNRRTYIFRFFLFLLSQFAGEITYLQKSVYQRLKFFNPLKAQKLKSTDVISVSFLISKWIV